MEVQDIKDKIENKIVAVATVNSEGKPHNIAIIYAKIKDDKIIITDNYMRRTTENIKNNPNVSLVFWEGKEGNEKGWRVDGKAEYHNSGKWLEFVKSLKENKGLSAKGAIVIEVEEVKELA